MSSPFINYSSLADALCAGVSSSGHFEFGPDQRIPVRDLTRTSVLGHSSPSVKGRCVLLAADEAASAALALIELDGTAKRIVLCPPDFPLHELAYVVQTAGVDTLVTDQCLPVSDSLGIRHIPLCRPVLASSPRTRDALRPTEWVLLTSGTTGRPKLVVHTLATLCGAIRSPSGAQDAMVWSTFYDIRRYGGLQILLRALLSACSLVLPGAHEPLSQFFARAASARVTHISGTPSHWRRALQYSASASISPRYVRLSGEIADQTILNRLRAAYPGATVAHAFASTEAGVVCEVTDGLAGLPLSLFGTDNEPCLQVQDGSLHVRSSRTALRYIGPEETSLHNNEGFVDTGDLLDLRDERYLFSGRRDGVVNVGGLKVHPEEVEAVLNRFPAVEMSLVQSRKSAVTGALVTAEVVLRQDLPPEGGRSTDLLGEILRFCHAHLPPHKVPASVRIVSALPIAASGKMSRRHA